MAKQIKAGVVGAGAFGANHVRKYAESAHADLVGVYDLDSSRATALAAPYGGRAYARLDDLLADVDVLTIATPAAYHAEVALRALAAGKPLYIEKPLAASHADGQTILQAAQQAGVIIACGHQERAVFDAMGLLDIPERPLALTATRQGPWSGRGADVSVTLDLMVHDLDLVLALGAGASTQIRSEAITTHSPFTDQIKTQIRFDNGMQVEVFASRIADYRARQMTVTYASGEVAVDFVARRFLNTTPYALNPDFAETAAGRDPLGASVEQFLMAVLEQSARPLVTGEEAYAALALALDADKHVTEPMMKL